MLRAFMRACAYLWLALTAVILWTCIVDCGCWVSGADSMVIEYWRESVKWPVDSAADSSYIDSMAGQALDED